MAHKTFTAATFNVNSIRSRMELVLDWLDHHRPDILCLQETKVQDQDFPEAPIRDAGFHVIFRGQKAHAGTAIVSRKKADMVAFGLNDGGQPDEARLSRARVGDIAVINTYVPQGRDVDSPHFAYKLDWLARLRQLFEREYSPDEPLLWAGDFNVAPHPVDIHDPKGLKDHVDFHPRARAALEAVRTWGFQDLFRLHHPDEPGHYTFWDYRVKDAVDRRIGWRVDHLWATGPLATASTGCWIDVEARRGERPSDHTFLVAEFQL